MLKIAVAAPRVFKPGKGFQYCNTNFVNMLGQIVEAKIQKDSLSQALPKYLFEPLKMAHSSVTPGHRFAGPLLARLHPAGRSRRNYPTRLHPLVAHLEPVPARPSPGPHDPLSGPGLWAREPLSSPRLSVFGCCLNPYSSKGERHYCFAVGRENGWIGHAGTLPGYNTQVSYLPERDIFHRGHSQYRHRHQLWFAVAVDAFQTLAAVIALDQKP